jgi:hypothetical protein
MQIWWASDLWDMEHGPACNFGSKAISVTNIIKSAMGLGPNRLHQN